MDTVEGLGDAARRARECAVISHAVTLARWIGNGRRPVTAGRVLRKADVPAAGAVLGVDVPPRLRTMADIRALHRPWCAAIATGLLQVGDGSVTAGPALECWPPDDADLLAGWLAGLRAVCAAESYPQDEDSVRLLALALLAVVGEDGAPVARGLWQPVLEALQVLCDGYDKRFWESLEAVSRYGDPESGKPLTGLVALLAGFGAVAGDPRKPAITPLGRWAAGYLAAGLAGPADPGLPAGEMTAEAARFGDEEQQDHVARAWLAAREPVRAAREVLAAAEDVSPLRRSVAVRLVEALGDDALPAWPGNGGGAVRRPVRPGGAGQLGPWPGARRRGLGVARGPGRRGSAGGYGPGRGAQPTLGSHAGRRPGCPPCGSAGHRPPGRLPRHKRSRSSSHPARRAASTRWPSSRCPLTRVRPPIWRRVLVPATATLGDLHVVIQVLFGWDGDHLHVFQIGKKRYADTFVNLEGTGDEDAVRVRDAMAPGGTIAYTYDLGACWEHEIMLEATVPRDHSQDYPVCVAFRGDSPVEYWCEEEPEKPEPFGQNEINRRLAALGREPA